LTVDSSQQELPLSTNPPLTTDNWQLSTNAGIFSLAELNHADWLPLLEAFRDADNLGSLITPPVFDAGKLLGQVEDLERNNPLFGADAGVLRGVVEQAELLRRQYWVVVANPPYMGGNSMNSILKEYAKSNHPASKSDIFAIFLEKIDFLTNPEAFAGLITPFVWMFISNYEDLRNKLLSRYSITSLIQLEYNAFEPACVPVCTFILTKTSKNYVKGGFIKLSEFKGHKNQALKTLEAIRNPEKCNYLFHACSNDFKSIPGEPIAYWITEKVKNAFSEHDSLTSVSHLRQGLSTTNNDRFIRFWHEPQLLKSSLYGVLDDLKWRPINKGGSYRKWFGNNDFLVNWECEGQEIKLVGGVTRNSHLYFKKGITWSSISSSNLSARIHNDKFIFSDVGQVL
jgi:hypothetical protein